MSNNIIATEAILPTNLDEAMRLATLIANSDLAPKDFKGKPENVLIAMQMGSEVGLAPMQSIQNIAVINGRPCVWGDAMLALVQSHPAYVNIHEWFDDKTMTAYCKITRKNEEPYTTSFSQEDATQAGLWNRKSPSPWAHYKKRMLQMRTRGFALRDKFADALKGLRLVEEVRDYSVEKEDHKKILDGILDNSADEKKPDQGKIENKPSEEKVVPADLGFIDEGQLKICNSLLSSREVDLEKCLDYFKINTMSELPSADYQRFIDKLSSRPLREGKTQNNN